MSKLIDISKLITLKNYSKKYGVTNRKIYRYIDSNTIDHVIIDGVPFVYDRPNNELNTDHRYKNPNSNVKTLTKKDNNVKTLTTNHNKNSLIDSLRAENDIVKKLTIGNVKTLTKEEQVLLNTPDVKLSGDEITKKYKLKKMLN